MKSIETARRPLCGGWLGIVLLLVSGSVWALSSDKDQPIELEADSVEIDDRTGISTYQGNVVIRQGSIRITADKVTVYQKDKRTDKIHAVGEPVTYQQVTDDGKEVNGRARQAEYHTASDELYLIGNALLTQGKDSFASDRITYDRKRALVKAGASAQGKERVRITIDPARK